ncbi:DUF2157 domain-containing protein [Natronococcus sp. JC468]|uniref:DUF2157 domain-containing protein n=1 Tax=Natronococcus sp. JC468 TaxID=1961921 RepID=UPI00143B0090|nr:DUF2157 domain-containing protein [Natronococcus sp. JC468]NKE34872.1 DUF2157 domain-containing protein [Natronococcus sp. JC468]
MTSLTEVYRGGARTGPGRRRLYAGTGLVALGAVLAVLGVVLATTELFDGIVAEATGWEMAAHYATVRFAGVAAGIGVPSALVGLFLVLPASRRLRAAGAVGAGLCLLGVALFWIAYPYHWRGVGADLTLEVAAVYLLGLFVAVWCLFVGVVNFKTRNDPGGTLEMHVTRRNRTIVERDDEGTAGGLGGIGVLGARPDGEIEPNARRDGGPVAATAESVSEPEDVGSDAELLEAGDEPTPPTDRYCGNCEQFAYARERGSNELIPYCTRHEEAMTGMDACEEWTPNRR